MPAVLELHWPPPDQVREILLSVAHTSGVPVDDVAIVRSPYRVCPLGAHIDHQGGVVSAAALNFGIILAFAANATDVVQLTSSCFHGVVKFSLQQIPEALRNSTSGEQACWGNFPRGAAFALLSKGYKLSRGLTGHMWSPPGVDSSGISSSAAVGVACLLALQAVSGLCLDPLETVELGRLIENEYLGLKSGILDQSAILLSRDKCLTVVDCLQRTVRHITPPWVPAGQPPPFKVLLAFSGLREALAAGSKFNARVSECQEAARQLLAAAQRQDGGWKGPSPILGAVTRTEFETLQQHLDPISRRRATHFFGECQRVAAGVGAWGGGDCRLLGALMNESGQSSIQNYEVGSPPLMFLQWLLQGMDGVYGCRFSGAGTRGACVALVERQRAQEVAEQVWQRYRQQYPELHAQAQVLLTDFGPGAILLEHAGADGSAN